MKDLASFLAENSAGINCVSKRASLDQIPALIAQSTKPIVFNDVAGYDMPVVDLLFANREAQARVLQCEPAQVVPELSRVLRRGPKPLEMVDSAPCKARK